ncbi:MAG: sulfatase-like hydrolase/transferase [Candidatus Desantisbacteria bacterium]
MIQKSYYRVRDFLIILSLVNLSFLSIWRELLFASPNDSYWMPGYTAASFVAAIINVVWISIVACVLADFVRRSSSQVMNSVGRIVFLFGFLFLANYIRMVFNIKESTIQWAIDHPVITIPISLLLAIAVLYVIVFQLKRVTHFFSLVLLIMLPFAVLTIGQATWKAISMHGTGSRVADVVKQTVIHSSKAIKQRVIWLMFDELDLRIAFTGRPKGIELPEFDRFRQQSLFALNAKRHSAATMIAIPSYITGKLVKKAITVDHDTLKLQIEGDEAGHFTPWTDYPTLFSQAHAIGANTAIIGIYHPYSRVFAKDYSFCSWYGFNTFTPQATNSIFTEMCSQLKGITPVFRRINAISTYCGVSKDTINIATDPHYDLIYVHASVPHGPTVYSKRMNRFTLFNISKLGYFDNLILADRFLGKLRHAMEKANLWDQTTILITSDHEWRFVYLYDNKRIKKVPFMLKMAGQDKQVVYDVPFSAVLVAKDLLLDVLSGHLTNTREVINWLSEKRKSQ